MNPRRHTFGLKPYTEIRRLHDEIDQRDQRIAALEQTCQHLQEQIDHLIDVRNPITLTALHEWWLRRHPDELAAIADEIRRVA